MEAARREAKKGRKEGGVGRRRRGGEEREVISGWTRERGREERERLYILPSFQSHTEASDEMETKEGNSHS